jgi:hypothetical protein
MLSSKDMAFQSEATPFLITTNNYPRFFGFVDRFGTINHGSRRAEVQRLLMTQAGAMTVVHAEAIIKHHLARFEFLLISHRTHIEVSMAPLNRRANREQEDALPLTSTTKTASSWSTVFAKILRTSSTHQITSRN